VKKGSRVGSNYFWRAPLFLGCSQIMRVGQHAKLVQILCYLLSAHHSEQHPVRAAPTLCCWREAGNPLESSLVCQPAVNFTPWLKENRPCRCTALFIPANAQTHLCRTPRAWILISGASFKLFAIYFTHSSSAAAAKYIFRSVIFFIFPLSFLVFVCFCCVWAAKI
jgi:hypothetical protein